MPFCFWNLQEAGAMSLQQMGLISKCLPRAGHLRPNAVLIIGFGPFRWVCSSGQAEDLRKSDQIGC